MKGVKSKDFNEKWKSREIGTGREQREFSTQKRGQKVEITENEEKLEIATEKSEEVEISKESKVSAEIEEETEIAMNSPKKCQKKSEISLEK